MLPYCACRAHTCVGSLHSDDVERPHRASGMGSAVTIPGMLVAHAHEVLYKC
jgi:hypothetical protein